MKKPQFINNEIYHVYNRGVEKRDIFLDKQDYFRFINGLSEFNDTSPALPSNIRYLVRNPSQATHQDIKNCLDLRHLNSSGREPLVEIMTFCLMPNHFHLLIRQVEEGGTVKFMKKLGCGYANYFNLKNKRVGSLFQGRFKAIRVDKDEYLRYLPTYIHLNPLDLIFPEWRDGRIEDQQKSLEYLENYYWSSYSDYISTGKNNFPTIIKKDFLIKLFGSADNFRKNTLEFIRSFNTNIMKDLTLE